MGRARNQANAADFQARSAYVRKLFCREDQALVNARQRAEQIHPEMMISPEEGKILQCLMRSLQAKKVLEIGTFTGYSALWIAKALPLEGAFWTLELQKEHARLARLGLAERKPICRYEVLEGPAEESLKALALQGPFDAVFVDADKGGYSKYLDWVEKHLRRGGLVIGDNTFLFGHIYKESRPDDVTIKAWDAMHQFNQRLADPQKYTSVILPTGEGMTIAIKEF